MPVMRGKKEKNGKNKDLDEFHEFFFTPRIFLRCPYTTLAKHSMQLGVFLRITGGQ